MGVRVRIKLEAVTGKTAYVIALLNSGAESERPSIALPMEIAEQLELDKLKAETAYSEEATTSVEIKLYRDAVKCTLIDGNEELTSTILDVAVAEGLTEPLLSDSAIDALNIEILSFSKGLWRIRGENKIRRGM
ncbi:hypothetical protein [Sulfurisphaera ohwakuensis]|uniref:Uncharacterized protein n=1 Tax=Sulfurisphaera ohwakuensis TaxID=69656 RepID=A0A7J9RWZ5_SULOH|nr:hypothetical protein [Sulfurisphaera ohwakuensis]MBB5253734.1 hypothetical protein [Sulfurisphaera ohwakuensis]